MPYDRISELPGSVRDHVPKHAQEIYKERIRMTDAATPRARKPRTRWRGQR